jgi:YVTN family beta-propeller protein
MSFRRVGRLAGLLAAALLCVSCGQVYRPVVIPIVTTPPTPSNFHAIFALTANVPNSPGGAMQIDVAGDSILAETPTSDPSAPNLGINPTHAAISPNDSRMFVASAGSVFPGQLDSVASFTPTFQFNANNGFGPVDPISLPSQTVSINAISESGNAVTATLSGPLNIAAGYSIVIAGVTIPGCAASACNAYNGTFTVISNSGTTLSFTNASASGLAPGTGGTASIPPQPVFLDSTENTAMYVANYNSNSVFAINTSFNVVSNSATVGANPVSLAETTTPTNRLKLYVANQGSNSISSLNSTDLSANIVTGFTGTNPVWVVARGDGQKVYVLTQGDGQLETIDTATDTVVGSSPVGAGANFIFYDPHLNRLYVTNPVTGIVYVFSDTGGANDTPIQLAMISMTAGANPPCPNGCAPTSVTALPDGSRFYVASYYLSGSPCPDAMAGTTSSCLVPGLTIFDANSLTVKYPSAPTLRLLTDPPFALDSSTNQSQYAVAPVAACGPVTPGVPTPLYSPATTRFRIFTAAANDSSRVYVSICDAGVIAVINTLNGSINNTGGSGIPADTVITNLPAPFSAGAVQANGLPANQSPIFLLSGQ